MLTFLFEEYVRHCENPLYTRKQQTDKDADKLLNILEYLDAKETDISFRCETKTELKVSECKL